MTTEQILTAQHEGERLPWAFLAVSAGLVLLAVALVALVDRRARRRAGAFEAPTCDPYDWFTDLRAAGQRRGPSSPSASPGRAAKPTSRVGQAPAGASPTAGDACPPRVAGRKGGA
ncbi:MAG: hypothetical protein PGN13_16435 [Patulibacter minatonensis]